MPLVQEKVSDKISKHIKATFDKLEQTLHTVQNTQKETPEKALKRWKNRYCSRTKTVAVVSQ